MGRFRSEASPSKQAVIAWPPATPIIKRMPVPELPKSRVSRGASSEPMPQPWTRQRPSPQPLHLGAKRRAGGGGAQNVVAFEQALDFGLADAEKAENQGAVRNRLVARRLAPGRAMAPPPAPGAPGATASIECPLSE